MCKNLDLDRRCQGGHRAFAERPLPATGRRIQTFAWRATRRWLWLFQDGIALLVGSVPLLPTIAFALSRVAIRGSRARAILRASCRRSGGFWRTNLRPRAGVEHGEDRSRPQTNDEIPRPAVVCPSGDGHWRPRAESPFAAAASASHAPFLAGDAKKAFTAKPSRRKRITRSPKRRRSLGPQPFPQVYGRLRPC
jgi:hypothetical protein